MVGTLLIGLLADPDSPAGVAGLFYGGGVDQLWRQAVGAFAVLVYSFIVSWVIGTAIHKTIGFRVTPAEELSGIDLVEHSEVGYDFSPVYYSALGSGVRRSLLLDASHLPESELNAEEAQ